MTSESLSDELSITRQSIIKCEQIIWNFEYNKIWKLKYLNHIMRNERRYGLRQLIHQGRIIWRKGPVQDEE